MVFFLPYPVGSIQLVSLKEEDVWEVEEMRDTWLPSVGSAETKLPEGPFLRNALPEQGCANL